jgi:hypothetical protein
MNKRIDTVLKSFALVGAAMAITAGTAAASAGPSPLAQVGSGSPAQQQSAVSSINATLNSPESTPSVHSAIASIVGGGSYAKRQADYTSVNASLTQPAAKTPVHTSVAAITGAGVSVPRQADYTSVVASLSSPVSKSPVHSSLASLEGAPQPVPATPVTVVKDDSGFDWTAAFVGAAGALVLALLSLATVHMLRRREGVTIA